MEWKSHMYGGGSTATFGRFTLSINWSEDRTKPGYNVRFNNSPILKTYPEHADAKKAAIAYARKALLEALAALGDEHVDEKPTKP